MKELLFRRKSKFIQFLIASFMFVIEFFARMGLFALILGAIEKKDIRYFKIVVTITILFLVYTPINFIISRLLRTKYKRDTILDIRKLAFDKIMNLSYKQYKKKSKEVYISNLINDVNTFESKFFFCLLNFTINISMFVLSLIFLAFLDIKLAFCMALFSFVLYFLANTFSKKTTALEQEISHTNEQFTTDVSNIFNGMEILKLNNMEDEFRKKSIFTINRVERSKFAANVFTEFQGSVIKIMAFVSSVAVMIYLAYNMHTGISLARAAFIFQLCSSISNFLIETFPMWTRLKASVSIYEKIANPDNYEMDQEKGSDPFHFNNTIQVSNINFSYEDKQILKNASFTIEKGKKYLIKGVSGAGKTTLMNLLAMAYDDYAGHITVDGVDFKDISESSFHNKVSFIYQDVFLFEDTIRNNITLYKEIAEEQVNYAVKVSGLDSIIQEKPNGIHEKLTENGKNLSGGQRQRISIARALAKNADILFVDEGTSSLNEELGREIEKVFLELNSTVIAISHRFYEDVTDHYDYVLEIKNGNVNSYSAKEYFDEVITC